MFDVRAANQIIISTRKRGSQLLSALQHDATMVPKRTPKRHETMHGIKLEIVVPNLVRQNVYLNVLPKLVWSQNSIESDSANIQVHLLGAHFGALIGHPFWYALWRHCVGKPIISNKIIKIF